MVKRSKYQKASELPLVAVELGSHGIRAMAAQRVDNDLFKILGVEEYNEKPDAIEHGVVRRSFDAAYGLKLVLKLLANKIGAEIPTAFVSLGGASMRVVEVKATRDQVRKREIPKSLLEGMERECKQKIEEHHPQIAVLGVVPGFFVLDDRRQEEPPTEEQYATMIEGYYSAFYGKKALETNVMDTFIQAQKSIEHAFVRPEVLFSLYAAEDGSSVLEDGCAILDMGHQTTTLTVYKCGEYIYNEVVSMGSADITHFLAQQGITAKTAEQLKIRYGYASPEQVEKNITLKIPAAPEVGGTFHLTSEELADAIAYKLDEILAPLLEKLNTFAGRIGTLYITGGGSMLRGMDDYIRRRTSINVLYGAHDKLLTVDTSEQYLSPMYASLVGTLLLGQDYRDTHKDRMIQNPPLGKKITDMLTDLFSDQEYK